MTITISHTAYDQNGFLAPGASVVITEVDVYGVDVPASTHGPYTTTAAADGTWSKAVDGGYMYAVSETANAIGAVVTFVDVPAADGPYDLADIEFTRTVPDSPVNLSALATVPILGVSLTNYPSIPGWGFTGKNDATMLTNYDYFWPFLVNAPITVTGASTTITVGVIGAKIRAAIYRGDVNTWQPDALLVDSGDKTVTATTSSTWHWDTWTETDLSPGFHLLAFNHDTTMTIRQFLGVASGISAPVSGTDSPVTALVKSRTYGAFTDPGDFEAVITSFTSGWACPVLLAWTAT